MSGNGEFDWLPGAPYIQAQASLDEGGSGYWPVAHLFDERRIRDLRYGSRVGTGWFRSSSRVSPPESMAAWIVLESEAEKEKRWRW